MIRTPTPRELWVLPAILMIGVFLVPAGFFTVDEAIYYLGARAVAETGAFGIDNGFERFPRDGLKLVLLVNGPQGLTPQYPPGSAVLGGVLLPILGLRAFILLNALAAIAALFTVRKICLLLFEREVVARLAVGLLVVGTFWMEYALGVWPHAISAFFVLQAYWYILRYLHSEGAYGRDAILAGLFAGLGMLFRLDSILLVPAVGLTLALFADRIVRSALWFGAGLLPPLAAMAGLNVLKFGSANPLSYGRTGGNTDLASYGAVIAALCVGFVVLIGVRKAEWRPRRRWALGSAALVACLLLIVSATRPWIVQLWHGFQALVIDMRLVEEHRQFVQRGPGDTVRFFGVIKKALGQSMPWIALTAILLTGRIRLSDRRPIAALVIFIVAFTLPFLWKAWHGGGGGNMRYFLPAIPALCILCAKLVNDMWVSSSKPVPSAIAGIWGGLILVMAWTKWHPSGFEGAQQIASTYVLIATALAAIIAGFGSRLEQFARRLTIALFAGGVTLALLFASFDFVVVAKARATALEANQTVASMPPGSLVIGRPEWFALRLPGNGSIASARDSADEEIDAVLVAAALDAGYRVFVIEGFGIADGPSGFVTSETRFEFPLGRAIELRRP